MYPLYSCEPRCGFPLDKGVKWGIIAPACSSSDELQPKPKGGGEAGAMSRSNSVGECINRVRLPFWIFAIRA